MASTSTTAVQILAKLAAQLCVSTDDSAAQDPSAGSSPLLVRGDNDDCDFSSFPSLSLEETPGNHHTGIFTNRGDVESHVESLLSRPILLGQQPALALADDDDEEPEVNSGDSDSLDEFFVERLEDVPKLMLTHFGTSFSTLMNSRLRAYASFLARHALSLAAEEKESGVIGIEHKLDTMLGIGSQVCTGRVSSDFVVDPKGDAEMVAGDSDDETIQVSVPLKATICIHIALPHVKEDNGKEIMKVPFQVNGKICGIFAKAANDSADEPLLLQVAEVSLNMHELLTGMADQASKVISCIVDMTNAAFAVPLPSTSPEDPEEADEKIAEAPSSSRQSVTSMMFLPKKHSRSEDEEQDEIVSLSAEKCANLIDFLIGELDDAVLSPPTPKKVKIFEEPPLAMLNP